MKRFFNTLSQKWPEYLFEILVLIIGIYGAFALERWNEERKEREKETKILKELLKGLESDKRDISWNLDLHTDVLRSQEIILDWLKSNRSYNDSLDTHFAKSFRNTYFISNLTTYETLKDKGIDIISNESLRNQLTFLYDHTYEGYLKYEAEGFSILAASREKLDGAFLSFKPYDGKMEEMKSKMVPIDPYELKSNESFAYWLATYQAYNVILTDFMKGNLKRVDKLIENIKGVLKQRE